MRTIAMLAMALVFIASACANAKANSTLMSQNQLWDVLYDAQTGLLPSDASPTWEPVSYGAPVSVSGGQLHIGNSGSGGFEFQREQDAISAGAPITVEAQVRIVPSGTGGASLGIGTYNASISPSIYSDRILMGDRYNHTFVYRHDFTALSTIRLAYDGGNNVSLWVDGTLAASCAPPPYMRPDGPPSGVMFSSFLCDSYWNDVAYSHAFLPIPEPSTLLALLCGLAGFGVVVRRRRA